MRKFICGILLLIMCCFLCACDPMPYAIDREALSGVVSVELIRYDNPKQKKFSTWAENQFDKLVPFDSGNATVIAVLPEEKIADFLDSFSQSGVHHTYYAYDSPKDICLRFNYENGNFLIAWANYAENHFAGYIGEYSSDGTVLTFWGSFTSLHFYEDLVNRYFNYSLR